MNDKSYNLNQNIPGWNGIEILTVLAEHATYVPENGNILELGALFGRSTYALGHNKKQSVNLYVIDIWDTLYLEHFDNSSMHDNTCPESEIDRITNKIKKNPDRIDGNDFFDLWKHYTSGISNLRGIKGKSLMDNSEFPTFDLIIHDAGHSYDDVYGDLHHWIHKLKPAGAIIVDDYDDKLFPGCALAVNKVIADLNLKYEMVTDRNILLKR